MASTATIANPKASAAAKPENPLAANGSPNTNSAITSSAAERLPASPIAVPVWCSRCSTNGAPVSSSVRTPSRIT